MPRLRILHDTDLDLRMATRTLEGHCPATVGAVASYLLSEHNNVCDWGALPILLQLDRRIATQAEQSPTIDISRQAHRVLTYLARVMQHHASIDAIGTFILRENLQILLEAPTLYPGLQVLQWQLQYRQTRRLYAFMRVSVYQRVLQAYKASLAPGASLKTATFQLFMAYTASDLSMFIGTPRWQQFVEVVSSWVKPRLRGIQVPLDTIMALNRVSEEHEITKLCLASFIMLQELWIHKLEVTGTQGSGNVAELLEHVILGQP